ncbi:MAG: outer membrane beta-barrel family protein, partial [Cruoricaptor ignavus]|nr:outer membrane beta-barrel family protein [Cruoricaptor ignavus]
VLNIITKTTKKNSWNGNLSALYQQSTYATGKLGTGYNLKKNKTTFSLSLNYTNGSMAPTDINHIFYPNISWKSTDERRDYINTASIRLGLDYKISNKFSHGFTYNYIHSQPLVKNITKTELSNPENAKIDSLIYNKGRNVSHRNLHIFNYHIVYKIDSIGRKLSFDFDYFDFEHERNRNYTTEYFLPNLSPINQDYFSANRNFGNQDVRNFSINLDMEHPTKWLSLNYGVRFSSIKTKNKSEFYDIINKSEILDASQSNDFDYKENIQSYYFSAGKEFSDKWETKIGVRLENTNTEGFSATMSQVNRNSYTKLFPTFYIVYKPSSKHSFSINYGKRINRPNYGFLNPFRWVISPYSYNEGNPFLQPSFINNLELEYGYKDQIISNIYYSESQDGFEQVAIVNPDTKIQQIIPRNFIKGKVFGINQTFVFKPFTWFHTNVTANIYYSSTKSEIPVTLQYLSGWSGEFSLSNDITLNRNKTLFLNTGLWVLTRGVDNLDYNSSDIQLNATLKWLLFKKNLVVNFSVHDIINPKGMVYTSYSNGIKNSFQGYYDEQFFRLGITYNFGKKIDIDRRENKNKEEQERIE